MVRKTVTVLFADVTGSTALGESLDPEALRRVMTQYYDAARATLERHGGTVEKFIGDAVMAVFGIPQAHEDDALRALRAAVELRDADLGVTLRIGVNTGEVVTGDSDTLVTGDAVNVAARLEQAAAPGEVLVGDATYRLARNALRVEEAAPVGAKGKSEPVVAWRLVDVLEDEPGYTRRLDAPFVGRSAELEQLVAAYDRAAGGAAQLVTIIGAGGIGKSRLARELVTSAEGRARIVVGRCLSYGEGITYWPLAEIVRQVATDRDSIAALVNDERADVVADRIAAVAGLGGTAGAKEETQWAARRLLESLAADGPLIVVLDDLHWAEATFLDLVEYVADFAAGPILLLATARPDLLDARPGWTAPRPNALTLVLERLGDEETDELIDQLLSEAGATEDERRRVAVAAEGNPLFVEQLLAMRADSNGAELTIPPTIQALLASRIDALGPAERIVVERASVEGRLFHRGSVAELSPDDVRPDVGAHLLALVRKEFVRPDRARLPGDDGYRFAHILVRDAAYDAMPKELRADLHERFVAWIERVAAERTDDLEEILGYHLEQAALYRRQLGLPADDAAKRAAERLGASGGRAFNRGDLPAARNLLQRTVALLDEGMPGRARALAVLAETRYAQGELEGALSVADEAVAEAACTQDLGEVLHAWAVRWTIRVQSDPTADQAQLGRELEGKRQEAERLDDARALVAVLRLEHLLQLMLARFAEMGAAAERLLVAARAAGDRTHAAEAVFFLAAFYWLGPAPVEEAFAATERLQSLAQGPLEEAAILNREAGLHAMDGDFDSARRLIEQARATYEEFGLPLFVNGVALGLGFVELAASNPAGAEHVLRGSCDFFRAIGETGYLSTNVGYLAEALYELGRFDEAEEATRESESVTQPGDVSSELIWRAVRAKILARRGELEEALRLAHEAVEWSEKSDATVQIAFAYVAQAEVLRFAARDDDAIASLEHALLLYERKGDRPYIERTRATLDELRP